MLSRLCDLRMLIQAMRVDMDKFLKNAVYLLVCCWLGLGHGAKAACSTVPRAGQHVAGQ